MLRFQPHLAEPTHTRCDTDQIGSTECPPSDREYFDAVNALRDEFLNLMLQGKPIEASGWESGKADLEANLRDQSLQIAYLNEPQRFFHPIAADIQPADQESADEEEGYPELLRAA